MHVYGSTFLLKILNYAYISFSESDAEKDPEVDKMIFFSTQRSDRRVYFKESSHRLKNGKSVSSPNRRAKVKARDLSSRSRPRHLKRYVLYQFMSSINLCPLVVYVLY